MAPKAHQQKKNWVSGTISQLKPVVLQRTISREYKEN